MKLLKTAIVGVILSSTCLVSAANASLIFSDDFSDTTGGWTLDTTWEIGSTSISPGAIYNPDPEFDHTATGDNGVAGVVLGGNAPTNLHDFYYLTSTVIDTSGYSGLSFEFYRWLNSDYTPYMQNKVDVFDGSSWVNLWQSGASPGVQDSSWALQSFDISSYNNQNLQVRMGYNITSGGVYTVSQWNIDDVSISGVKVPEPSTLAIFALGMIGLASRRFKKQS